MKQITINPKNEPYYSKDFIKGFKCGAERQFEADKADRPQGKWIDKGYYAECSNCGADSGTQFDGVEPIPLTTKFCSNCGARMERSR